MKLTRSISALAFTAVALASTLGAQGRGGARGGGSHSPAAAARGGGGGGRTASRGRPSTPAPQHSMASRPQARGGTNYQNHNNNSVRGNRGDVRTRADARGYQDNRARADVRGREAYRGPVAHGRPVISRIGYRGPVYGGGRYSNGYRYYRGINRFGVNIVLPFGWERPLFVRGYFPATYMDYCEAVPVELEYMLPEMRAGYDPCLIGDRVVVYDRYSRGIVFSAIIP